MVWCWPGDPDCRLHSDSRISPVQGDANLADLAIRRLPAADLVGVELALGVEILPGFLEVDVGDRLLAAFTRGAGTWSKETAFLVMPGGRSASSQPAIEQANSPVPTRTRERSTLPGPARRHGPRQARASSVIIRHDLPPARVLRAL